MQPTQKYDSIITVINMNLIYVKVSKQSRLGSSTELDYPAIIISIFLRYVERISMIK